MPSTEGALFKEERAKEMNLILAYFDPSAGSLLLQAVVGGFGGFVVVGRYLWIQLLGNRQLSTAGASASTAAASTLDHTT